MQVTARGVETETVLSLLALMGCDAAQGYFISSPMPLGDLFEFLKRDPEQTIQIAPSLATVVSNLRSIHS
jgi:EAL domain-containing protein (putative c-di-GMP-specific phosphodiesterase class I)